MKTPITLQNDVYSSKTMKDNILMTMNAGTKVNLFLVGGAVRDHLMGKVPHDFDFAVEAESFDAMREWLLENNFEIFLETPQYQTIRARRKEAWVFGKFDLTGKGFDFVLCRKDGAYSDGRRPDEVTIGTIYDDLARRDFTMNAMAITKDGAILDPYNGREDIDNETIRCVGSVERLREDGLRILRSIRFAVQLDFCISKEINKTLGEAKSWELLKNVSVDRIRDELHKCFRANTIDTLYYLNLYPNIAWYIFEGTDLWLMPTTKYQKK